MHRLVHLGSRCHRKCARWCISTFSAMHSEPTADPNATLAHFRSRPPAPKLRKPVADVVVGGVGVAQVRDGRRGGDAAAGARVGLPQAPPHMAPVRWRRFRRKR